MRRRKPRSARTIKAAKLVASGKSQQEAAAELGISRQAVSKAVRAVLTYEEFDNIRNCRLIANRRLDSLRQHLLGLCGMVDDDVGGKPPKPTVEPSGQANVVRVLVQIEKRRAEMFGFDAPQQIVTTTPDPLESMSPEELLSACIAQNIPVPLGLREECSRRNKVSAGPAQAQSGHPRKALT